MRTGREADISGFSWRNRHSVQVYWPLSSGGNEISVNKYHIEGKSMFFILNREEIYAFFKNITFRYYCIYYKIWVAGDTVPYFAAYMYLSYIYLYACVYVCKGNMT